MAIPIVLSALLSFSLALNLFQVLRARALKSQPRKESYEVQELLTDLLAGDALVMVRRIAPADVLLRSPRGKA